VQISFVLLELGRDEEQNSNEEAGTAIKQVAGKRDRSKPLDDTAT